MIIDFENGVLPLDSMSLGQRQSTVLVRIGNVNGRSADTFRADRLAAA